MNIKVVIPARNEARAITKVISEIPLRIIKDSANIIVVDNGSSDETADIAKAAGATVISVPIPGYGRACLAGIKTARPCDIVVFLDGDASDFPEDMAAILQPILDGKADIVIGSRLVESIEKGSLTVQQRFGNRLACWLMTVFWNGTFTDLGPFRAIKMDALDRLNMQAPTYGWTVEMQVRALKAGLPYQEVPVRYRKRIGKSKISGTIRGVVLAGTYILGTIARERMNGKSYKN